MTIAGRQIMLLVVSCWQSLFAASCQLAVVTVAYDIGVHIEKKFKKLNVTLVVSRDEDSL